MEKVVAIIAVILIIFIGFSINKEKTETSGVENDNVVISEVEGIVSIRNGKIENENLLDDFLKNANSSGKNEIELNIETEDKSVKVKFTPGENALNFNSNGTGVSEIGDGSLDSNKRIYGYYSIYRNNQLSRELELPSWYLNRITKDGKVILRFETFAKVAREEDLPVICEYDLESSKYKERFSLTYSQRKDMGIYELFDATEYKINSFGGDVNIKINEIEYSLKEALNNKIITPEEILEQLKDDSKYGICYRGDYSDGGSTEYVYDKYTILKLNTLDGDKDLVIGMSGQIINDYNKQK